MMTKQQITLTIALTLCSPLSLSAQQSAQRTNQGAQAPCERYKMRVIKADEKVDSKAVIPPETVGPEYKGIIINPCQDALTANGETLYHIQKFAKHPHLVPPGLTRNIDNGWKIKSTSEMFRQVLQQPDKPKTPTTTK